MATVRGFVESPGVRRYIEKDGGERQRICGDVHKGRERDTTTQTTTKDRKTDDKSTRITECAGGNPQQPAGSRRRKEAENKERTEKRKRR